MKFLSIGVFLVSASAYLGAPRAEDSAWVSILPAQGLAGWTPYYQKGPANPDSSWGVTPEGWLNVNLHLSYNTTGVGHLFYTKRKLSYYMVRSVYRFTSTTSAPDWGGGNKIQNNGLMIHSQAPETMTKDQDFPISIEVQLLGGGPTGDRSTANVCTPGTEIFQNGAMVKGHCTNSTAPTFRGDQWVRVEVEVHGSEHIRHIVGGKTVIEYDLPQIGGTGVNNFDPAVKKDGALLSEGYITIQGESHPTEFRKIELLNLSGCMDSKASNYKSYYVHRDDQQCNYTNRGRR